jgi:hypothetical protein
MGGRTLLQQQSKRCDKQQRRAAAATGSACCLHLWQQALPQGPPRWSLWPTLLWAQDWRACSRRQRWCGALGTNAARMRLAQATAPGVASRLQLHRCNGGVRQRRPWRRPQLWQNDSAAGWRGGCDAWCRRSAAYHLAHAWVASRRDQLTCLCVAGWGGSGSQSRVHGLRSQERADLGRGEVLVGSGGASCSVADYFKP